MKFQWKCKPFHWRKKNSALLALCPAIFPIRVAVQKCEKLFYRISSSPRKKRVTFISYATHECSPVNQNNSDLHVQDIKKDCCFTPLHKSVSAVKRFIKLHEVVNKFNLRIRILSNYISMESQIRSKMPFNSSLPSGSAWWYSKYIIQNIPTSSLNFFSCKISDFKPVCQGTWRNVHRGQMRLDVVANLLVYGSTALKWKLWCCHWLKGLQQSDNVFVGLTISGALY